MCKDSVKIPESLPAETDNRYAAFVRTPSKGPHQPQLGIATDMSIQLKAASDAICTLSLSFNNVGQLGTGGQKLPMLQFDPVDLHHTG
jgi:hypothetical protein